MNILMEDITLPNCQKNLQKPAFLSIRYPRPTATLITLYTALFVSFLQYGNVDLDQTFD